jgi:prepilin-type N-terminal cleavage/methylation domain-containing protein
MGKNRGFTLLETVIASTIISIMMLGMIGILATHSNSAGKSRDSTFAANLAQQEIDVILADLKVQQSLASKDTVGRSTKSFVYGPSSNLNNPTDSTVIGYVLNYFYNNFDEVNHEAPADPPYTRGANFFKLGSGNRFYDLNGVYIGAATMNNSVGGAKYVSRVQVFALPQDSASDRLISSVEKNEATYLLGDTNNALNKLSYTDLNGKAVFPMRKLLVVKVYDYKEYVDKAKNLSKVPVGRELAKMKLILYGDA